MVRETVYSYNAKQQISEYLESLIHSAREGKYIVPPPEAARKIEEEIEHRTKLSAQNLVGHGVKITERIVSANPEDFVQQALNAIDELATSLQANHATGFEVAFRNPQEDPNWDFAKAKLAVRYTTSR
jgi:hypothetical protein